MCRTPMWPQSMREVERCSVLIVIGGGQALDCEGTAMHQWSLARLDAPPKHVHIRVGDRF